MNSFCLLSYSFNWWQCTKNSSRFCHLTFIFCKLLELSSTSFQLETDLKEIDYHDAGRVYNCETSEAFVSCSTDAISLEDDSDSSDASGVSFDTNCPSTFYTPNKDLRQSVIRDCSSKCRQAPCHSYTYSGVDERYIYAMAKSGVGLPSNCSMREVKPAISIDVLRKVGFSSPPRRRATRVPPKGVPKLLTPLMPHWSQFGLSIPTFGAKMKPNIRN